MKLRRFRIENVRSFLESKELLLDGDISILIGPNGGGKTNILDAAITSLRRHLITSWLSIKSPTAEIPDRHELRSNDAFNANVLEKHSLGQDLPQRIELDLEVTSGDVKNMLAMKASAIEVADLMDHRFIGLSIREASEWDPAIIKVGQRFTYTILNNNIEPSVEKEATLYRLYLARYDAFNSLRNELRKEPLSMLMMSMPVNRSASGFQASLILSSHVDSDVKKMVDAANSRSGGSMVTLAIGRLAGRYRILLESDTGNARNEFYADPQIESLSRILKTLGYTWELECTDPLTNRYDVRLTKQGTSFLIHAASSGEKEFLTYLFAIYALNVRDALIVIDEPELHLHPQWQASLLTLFEQLSAETGNQFLLATHSPVFISPSSIPYVSRVFSKEQKSEIIRLKGDDLPTDKHLFSIVNSQNNERMFFSDKVVLVEGFSDRLFFEAVFKKLGVWEGSNETLEIIEVGGKGLFLPYQKILTACRVPFMIIADLDYVNQIGTNEIKQLFAVNKKKIATDVIKNETSVDGIALVERLDEAIKTGHAEDLTAIWNYIKLSRTRLKSDLDARETKLLNQFISEKQDEGIFVLSLGTLESYLPEGYRSKDVEKLIKLLARDFWTELPEKARNELSTIAGRIKPQNATADAVIGASQQLKDALRARLLSSTERH